jgi:hypothetical protein
VSTAGLRTSCANLPRGAAVWSRAVLSTNVATSASGFSSGLASPVERASKKPVRANIAYSNSVD